MWMEIREVIIYTFFVYGIINFIIQIFSKKENIIGLKNVLVVKNQQDTVEWIVQNAVKNVTGKLMIVDMGSNDDTWRILEKLKLDNYNIEIFKEEDKIKIFEQED